MGELTDKAKGAVNKVVGGAKQQSDDPDTAPTAISRK